MSAEERVTEKEKKTVEKAQEELVKRLEDDDEFEDFPEDDWEDSETVGAAHKANLWEESWEDHDDLTDDFTARLRSEIEKHTAASGK